MNLPRTQEYFPEHVLAWIQCWRGRPIAAVTSFGEFILRKRKYAGTSTPRTICVLLKRKLLVRAFHPPRQGPHLDLLGYSCER